MFWYVRTPSPLRYALALLLFAFGLMSKPMLVTLPLLMLLLDFWPLRRWQPGAPRSACLPLLKEKIPFFLLSVGSSLVTFLISTSVVSGQHLPTERRLANAIIACVRYIGKLLWPQNMAAFYPYPAHELCLCGRWEGLPLAVGRNQYIRLPVSPP